MDNYSSHQARQYGMNTSPSTQQQHQHRLESTHPDQQLPSIRDVIPPVRSNGSDTGLQDTSSTRHVAVPYLSSHTSSVMSVAPVPAPVQPQATGMGYSTENSGHLHVNTMSSALPLTTPSRTPAEYNSPWSASSQYHDPQMPVCPQTSLPAQSQSYSNMVQPLSSDHQDSSSFSSNYSSLNRTVPMMQESPVSDSYGRWRPTTQTTPQRYNPYVLSSDRSYNQSVDYQRYNQSPFDSYRSNMGYDSSFRPVDSSPYHARYNPLMSYPTLMGYSSQVNGRRRRGNLPKPITDILRMWLQEHLDHPYPTDEQKQLFIQRTGLTISQISNWFINARRRQLPALKLKRQKMIQSRA